MNIDKLRAIQAQILAEPKRLTMQDFSLDMIDVEESMRPQCETVACLAGWTVALDRVSHGLVEPVDMLAGYDGNYVQDAQKVLDLTDAQALRLFYSGFWPAQFKMPVFTCVDEGERLTFVLDSVEPGVTPEYLMAEWPVAGNLAPQTPEYASLVSSRIDHFIATDGAE